MGKSLLVLIFLKFVNNYSQIYTNRVSKKESLRRNNLRRSEQHARTDRSPLDTEPLITHTYPLSKIDEAYELFENKRDGVIKVAVEC